MYRSLITATGVLLLGLALPAVAQTEAPPVRVFQPYQETAPLQALDTPITDTLARPLPTMGRVAISADPRIERLMDDYKEHVLRRPGYRVQIFLGDRRTAEENKREFLRKYPDLPAYMSYLAPNFRLRVGDLRTRLEAERLLQDLKALYPGSYIVPDEIEPPRLP